MALHKIHRLLGRHATVVDGGMPAAGKPRVGTVFLIAHGPENVAPAAGKCVELPLVQEHVRVGGGGVQRFGNGRTWCRSREMSAHETPLLL